MKTINVDAFIFTCSDPLTMTFKSGDSYTKLVFTPELQADKDLTNELRNWLLKQ